MICDLHLIYYLIISKRNIEYLRILKEIFLDFPIKMFYLLNSAGNRTLDWN
jgi:hypothetical protein